MSGQDELTKKLSEWLKKGGYPFEMRVARAFQDRGFAVSQSDYYVDPDTNISREIDITALVQKHVGGVIVRVEFVIECKSVDKPWVIFASPEARFAPPFRVGQRAASRIGVRALMSLSQREEIQNLDLFQFEDTVGYGLAQAFANDSDVAYRALMSAAKAAKAAADQAEVYARMARPLVVFEFPVVAIDGKLFKCALDEKGEISISSILSATLLWRNPVAGMPNTVVEVLTAESVDQYAKRCAPSAAAFLELCGQDIEKARH